MQTHDIRNLLFDLGNVIIDIDMDGAMDRLRKLMRKDAMESVIQDTLIDYECGRMTSEDFINALITQSAPDVQDFELIKAWNSMLTRIPFHRLEMLKTLRRRYNVCVLSNTNALHLHWVHQYVAHHFQIEKFEATYFDQAFYSHWIADRKPSATIFRYVVENGGLIPAETLFMDDMPANIAEAHKQGFKTYLVRPGEEIGDYLKREGFY